jgi:glycosyltransferase involved in cell wall biosynthesis
VTLSILWLGRIIPLPFNAGDRVYSAQLAGSLARNGPRVVFLGLENPDETGGRFAELEPRVQWRTVPGAAHSRMRSLFSPLPMVGARFATEQYRQAITRELESNDYDVVVFDQYGMSWAVACVRKLARNQPFLVHVAHNFESAVNDQIARNFSGDFARKWLLRRNARKTRLAERHLASFCNLFVTLTEQDRAAFKEINPSLESVVIPPGYAGARQRSRRVTETVARRAIIVGSFRWTAKQINLERLLEAADVILTQHRIELHVIGFVPEPFLSRLQSRFPWVVFRGFLDDLGKEFRNVRIALVPEEIGGGFKLKILDYIFSRVPVAAVAAALNGIPDQLKTQFIVEDDIAKLMTGIVAAIDDVDRLDGMQNRAFELAENLFDWNTNGQRLLDALNCSAAARSDSGSAKIRIAGTLNTSLA